MKVRIFSALTMQEAMNQVKETLGRDAIILHTRKFRKGGIGGFFGREMIEVMAAVDNDVPMVTLSANNHGAAKQKTKSSRKNSSTPVRSLLRNTKKTVQEPAQPMVPAALHAANPETVKEMPQANLVQKTLTEKIIPEQPAVDFVPALEPLALTRLLTDKTNMAVIENSEIEKAAEVCEEKPLEAFCASSSDEELKDEIIGMRQMLEQLLAKTKTIPNNPWYDYLIKKEIQPSFAEQVLKGFPHSLTMLNKNPEATRKMLYERFVGYIRSTNGIELDNSNAQCQKIALIGPTGVGKTTTLAKLAARFTLEQNASVAFITSDTYRIAAVEQLKTYANILNITLDVVYSPDELKKCINKHQDKQLILIDTAGRSQYNEEQMEELVAMLAVDENIQAHLVLSSTTKHQDAVDIIEKFSPCSSDKLIFTKIDEARNIGNIFNIMYEFPELAISYITDGQSVPDDIHPAQPSHLTDMLLRE